MSLIMFLGFGLVVGTPARLIAVPGREPGGLGMSILFGVLGSFLGGFLGRAFSLYREGRPAGFLVSLVGAILVVAAYRAFARRKIIA